MNIWTERLERRHLPVLAQWAGRTDGAMTPGDFPPDAAEIPRWLDCCAAEPGRLDCLILAYETPVGLAGLLACEEKDAAALYLLLCEVNYNPLRTATYATLRMLDRAFSELDCALVTTQVYARHGQYLNALECMGFSRTAERDGLLDLRAEKDVFLRRKYLF